MTTVLNDYTARSSQELTVVKGQHVRVVQKQLPNAPDWCLVRLLNDHHHQQQTQPNPSSFTRGSVDLSLTSLSKYTVGFIPAVILKSTKSSSSNAQLPPPLSISANPSKSEHGKYGISSLFSSKFRYIYINNFLSL